MNFGMDFAIRNGKERFYVELLSYGYSMIEYHIDQLLDAENLTKEELGKCILAWKQPLIYCPRYKEDALHTAYSRILSDDFSSGEDQKAVFHFYVLKELYKQRQKELDNILNSTTFKIAKTLTDLKDKISKSFVKTQE